ncbi:hypothetical protein [Vibrio mediterranei]|uniref:Uncharacterized protein n=1 Tax=Vibrio mediterranei TaxID=689 RepID=A0ABX5DA24_9VIBR|nr:hypothetical protein [Vibrio mediterranei]MCG9658657.1 hypothetical protein [Vibrio mediterranei]PRQ65166.1 hypothetical protein COR51_23890 [Vibrio mediterranei]
MASQQVENNQRDIQRMREQGRKEIRGRLEDKHTTDLYEEMAVNIPKRNRGRLLSAMVKLAHEAQKKGQLVISEDGTVELKTEKTVNCH